MKPGRGQSGMFEFLTLSLVFLAGISSPVSSLTPEQRELIDEVIDVYMSANFVPGLALSIVENNGANSLAIGYGLSRIESETPFTSQTRVAIASVTKSFTAVLTAKVLNENFPQLGEAVLDTPISQLLTGFNFTFSDRFRSEFMTFRDLLSHRSCLYNTGLGMIFDANTAEQYNYRIRYQPEVCSFRTAGIYNNHLYALAGNMIAHIAGTTFEELTRSFFDELGMSNSQHVDKDGAHEQVPAMSHAYFRKDNQTHRYNTTHLRRLYPASGAGALLSTASDMSQYLKFHLNKGRVGNREVVPEEVLNWVYKVAIPFPSIPNESGGIDFVGLNGFYGVGLGFILGVYEGSPMIFHGGSFPPYESSLNLFPEQQLGIFFSTNGPGVTGTYPGQMSQTALSFVLVDIVNGNVTSLAQIHDEKYSEQKLVMKDNLSLASRLSSEQQPFYPKKVQTPPPHPKLPRVEFVRAEDIVGSYGSPADGDVTITLDQPDETAFIYFGTYGYGDLIQVSDVLFRVEWTSSSYDDVYANGNVPLPIFTLDFSTADQFLLQMPPLDESIIYYKDRLIDTLPPVPWNPNSCGPESSD